MRKVFCLQRTPLLQMSTPYLLHNYDVWITSHLECNHLTSCHTHHHPTPFDSCCPRTASGMDRCCMPALQAESAGSGQESVVFAKNQTINSGEKCYGTANSSLLLSFGSRYSVNRLRFPLKACIVLPLEGCCEE